jgi:hypothetical protein
MLDAMRQSIDRLIAGHELILRSIDQIAIRVTVDHDEMRHNTDQTATNIDAGQKHSAASIDQTPPIVLRLPRRRPVAAR